LNLKENRMKLAAIAITLAFAATPALAQQAGYPSTSNPSGAASPSAMDQATPGASTNSSTDDTRVASNQRHHKRSQSSTGMSNGQGQMDNSQAQSNSGSSAGGGSAMPSPAPQQ
jgi:hypothetical protein